MTFPMRFEKTVTLGNILTGIIFIVGLVSGYTLLEASVSQNARDNLEIKSQQRIADKLVNTTQIDIAVIRVQVEEINKKLDRLQK